MQHTSKLRRGLLKLGFILVSAAFLSSAMQAKAAPFGELMSFWDDREDNNTQTLDHSIWQALLNEYLDDQTDDGVNRFNYDGMSVSDKNQLDSYLAYLQGIEPRQLNSNEQMAYWINLYNATTVSVVVEQGPDLSSIRQIRSSFLSRGPWKLKLLNIAQQDLTLDDVEHRILRPLWRDKRIHYAVNCASIGCPNLHKTAFTAQNLESLLEQGAKDYINHPRGVNVVADDLILSSIFDWYSEDFGPDFNALMEHLLQYADPELASQIQDFSKADYDYDWDLNSVTP